MSDFVQQKLMDSEESYLNTTFWDVHPLFLLIQNGETVQLKKQLHVQLEKFPAGRITKDARKQLEYLTISLINTFMIAAIQGSVYPPEANAIADQALRRLSQIKSLTEIPVLVSDAALRFSEMVRITKDRDSGNVHVEKAKHYISDHLTQEIHTEDIAAAVGLSPYHLSHLFKRHIGLTMREYLIRERIESAKQLLAASDRTIPEIASLLRFCDQSYFTAVFRRQTGRPPGEYRKKNQR